LRRTLQQARGSGVVPRTANPANAVPSNSTEAVVFDTQRSAGSRLRCSTASACHLQSKRCGLHAQTRSRMRARSRYPSKTRDRNRLQLHPPQPSHPSQSARGFVNTPDTQAGGSPAHHPRAFADVNPVMDGNRVLLAFSVRSQLSCSDYKIDLVFAVGLLHVVRGNRAVVVERDVFPKIVVQVLILRRGVFLQIGNQIERNGVGIFSASGKTLIPASLSSMQPRCTFVKIGK
jgi:hypothetical protein